LRRAWRYLTAARLCVRAVDKVGVTPAEDGVYDYLRVLNGFLEGWVARCHSPTSPTDVALC